MAIQFSSTDREHGSARSSRVHHRPRTWIARRACYPATVRKTRVAVVAVGVLETDARPSAPKDAIAEDDAPALVGRRAVSRARLVSTFQRDGACR